MAKEVADTTGLMEEIDSLLKSAEDGDLDAVYDRRASIVSMFAQAMVEFHFQEEQLEWLSDILRTVEDNNLKKCRSLLEQGSDTDRIFLASQFAAMMAGCFHHDELMTVAQAIGLKALLEAVEQSNASTN